MFILDDYRESGTDFLQFVDAINMMANRTEVVQLPKNLIRTYTVMGENDKYFFLSPNTGFSPVFDDETETVSSFPQKIKKFSKERIVAKGMNEQFLKEISDSKTIFVMDGKTTLFVGEGLFNTFGQRLDLTGRRMNKPSFVRNELVQEVLDEQLDKPDVVTAILRTQNGVKKVFAVHSNSYPYVPQTILPDIAERFIAANYSGLGEAVCDGWEVNHHYSTIKVVFPQKAKAIQATYGLPDEVVPGLILTTSDLGENSVTVKGIFSIRGSSVVQKVIKKQHKGVVNPDDVIDKVDREVFSEYTKLPARLCELMTIDVADVQYSLDEAFRGLGIRKFGDKTSDKITEALTMELPAGGSYTAYDLAMSILSLQGRLSDVPVYTLRELEGKCAKAPFLKWEKFAALSDGDVVVTA